MKQNMVKTSEMMTLLDSLLEQVDLVDKAMSTSINETFTHCEETYMEQVHRIDQSLQEIEVAVYESMPSGTEWSRSRSRREMVLHTV
ncbi:hypothetical protein ACLHDF_09510 [Priestia aryabhattai]|uniref:hypothetical protein n=1 Tax=Priestia megaterium TaxID=1404 RepID=UPI0039B90FB1